MKSEDETKELEFSECKVFITPLLRRRLLLSNWVVGCDTPKLPEGLELEGVCILFGPATFPIRIGSKFGLKLKIGSVA